VTSRAYTFDEAYIDNARGLDEDMHERRAAYRREILKDVRKQKMADLDERVRQAEEEAFRDHEEERAGAA
jgi:hypothetical protein